MQKTLIKLFYCILLIFALNRFSMTWSLNSKVKTCPEEKTLKGIFEWKINDGNDVKYVISQPDVCWDNGSIVLRQCNFKTGEWFPNQVQCSKFRSKNIKCPDDLIELPLNDEYLCLKISSEAQTFDEHFCYGSNVIPGLNTFTIDHKIFKFLLKEYNITSFWLPIKRYEENKFNPFVIRLPGKQWNELFDDRGEMLSAKTETLSDKHCVAAYIQREVEKQKQPSIQMEMTHCSESHYSICVFRKHFVAKSGCPQDSGALSHRPNECYGITWDGQKYPDDFRMLNVTEYFKKVNTINIIFHEFDIENEEYVELEGIVQVPNGKWAIKPKNNHMKIVSSGKTIHGLCVEHIESRKNVDMILRMDTDLESLILTVYNKFYIWSNDKPENSIHCFTNADYGELSKVELKKIWENKSHTKTIFKLKIKNDDPGQYWCEAHTIFNFTHVSSAKVVAAKAKKGHAFAMQIEAPIKSDHLAMIFSHDQMKQIATCIKDKLKTVHEKHKYLKDLVLHNVRIMDILYIYPNTSYLRCLCHTTVSIKSSSVDTSKEQHSEEDSSAEDDEGVRHDTAVRMKARDLLINLIKEYQPHFSHTVRSTEFCFPENDFMLARIGQSATKSKFCLQRNGLPITRRCLGNFTNGAFWEELTLDDCITITEANLITRNLYTLDITKTSKDQPEKAVRDVRKLLESNLHNLIPADLYYLAKIIGKSIKTMLKIPSRSPTQTMQTLDPFSNYFEPSWSTLNFSETAIEVVRIFNYLLEVNDRVIRPSIELNATNILLDTFEFLIDHMSSVETFQENITTTTNQTMTPLENLINDNDKEIDIIEYLDVGVVVQMATNFVAFVISPQVANITGVALFRADVNSDEEFYDDGFLKGAFKNEYYRFVLANQSVDELLNEPNILMGTFVPTSLWQRLDEISRMSNNTWKSQRPEPKVVIKIYANDKMFQETNLTADRIVYGKVISISIPGHDKDLPEILPLILTVNDEDMGDFENYNDTQKQYCSYWNYQTWASDGVMVLSRSELNNNTVLCGCTHLTPFAYLIGGSYNLSVDSEIEVIVKKIHKQALDIITLLGCSLSLFGIAGIFVTACTFRSWRKKANSKVLLQLSAAIALQMILFCFVNTEENSQHLISNKIFTSCITIGACLHYSVLVQFCWMVIIAYLQFKRYVQVFGNTRPKRFFIKSTILGWGLPLIPVACVLVFDSDSYIPHQNESTNPLCYPSGISFYVGIVLPITLIIIANLVIFFVVIYNILKHPAGSIRHTEKSLAISQIRLLVLLFFLLGFTWIFGLLNAMKAGLVFSYLFCLTATLQGFILFLYFVIMDPVTRRMWYGFFMKLCGLNPKNENSSSAKESTQSF
ncbi:uncharacterized protein LOC119606500 [Lucilia sericata]|uniref:uncharacterized protein LOC119606500 n=1 Tax=Lucilia sericata TaxID=13632 RepID=UPI0018A82B81|nr:uncharacterized protein LOC119606500 [Lucilia sericata]